MIGGRVAYVVFAERGSETIRIILIEKGKPP